MYDKWHVISIEEEGNSMSGNNVNICNERFH